MNSKNLLQKMVTTFSLIVLIGLITACNSGNATQQTESAQAAPSTSDETMVVSAEAYVVPVQEAELSFKTGGQVVTVEVEEGETVKKNQPLAQVDNASQQLSLAQAKADLDSAQASLNKTKASATAEQIAQAEATLAKAEAALAEQMAGPTAEKVAEAAAQVETARASLAQVLAGTRDEEIQAAAATMLQAEADVREAQADYDAHVYGDPDRLGPYGLALQQATLTYEGAKADYDKLVNGSTVEEIAVYRAQLNEAQAALNSAKAGATPEQIAQAQAEVANAEAALAELKAGATPEEIAVAQASVKSAQIGVTQAQLALENTILTAPFTGTIGQLKLNEGEMATAGTAVIALADTTRWQIETDDLNETDVVGVKVGATVHISVDALPNEEFEGKVVRITPKAETKSGDQTYTVRIDITQGDTSQLRWGMTTFVDVETETAL